MKNFLLILILPCLLSFSLLVKELYTQKQVENLVSEIVDGINFKSSENGAISFPITLSDLLRKNKYAFQRKKMVVGIHGMFGIKIGPIGKTQ